MNFKAAGTVLMLLLVLLPTLIGRAQVIPPEPTPLELPPSDGEPVVTEETATTPLAESTLPPAGRSGSRPTPTATPTTTPQVPDFVYRWANEVVFPQAVYFNLVINYPLEEISVLTFSASVDRAAPRVLDRSALLPYVFITEPYTEIRYIWQAGDTPVLPLLSSVEYRWQIVLANGEEAVIPDAFVFNDAETPWAISPGPDGILGFIYPQGIIDPVPSRPILRSAYDLMVANTDTQNPPPFNFVLFTSSTMLDRCPAADGVLFAPQNRIDIPCAPPAAETIVRTMDYTPLQVAAGRGFGLQRHLIREMMETLYAPLWAERDLPAWFKTGLVYLYFPDEKGELIGLLRASGRVYPPYTLAQMAAYDPETMPLWEAQAYGMVLLMARQIGLDGIFALAAGEDEGQNFAQAYEALAGQSLEALLPYWQHWIYSGQAARDAELDLYQGMTPVPPATQTATPFPASPTPTSTSTPTSTPTPTVTGVLTATPLPTLTPTLTLSPPPPTITPLPAGARPTVTPVPVAAVNPHGSQGFDDTIVIVLAGLIVLGAIGSVWWMRSRGRL